MTSSLCRILRETGRETERESERVRGKNDCKIKEIHQRIRLESNFELQLRRHWPPTGWNDNIRSKSLSILKSCIVKRITCRTEGIEIDLLLMSNSSKNWQRLCRSPHLLRTCMLFAEIKASIKLMQTELSFGRQFSFIAVVCCPGVICPKFIWTSTIWKITILPLLLWLRLFLEFNIEWSDVHGVGHPIGHRTQCAISGRYDFSVAVSPTEMLMWYDVMSSQWHCSNAIHWCLVRRLYALSPLGECDRERK